MDRAEAYAALVKSLEYSVTDYPHNPYDSEWDNWYLRDVVEQGCLLVLGQLVDKFGPSGAVRARFVERWLVKEPWGATDEDRQLNFYESLLKDNLLNKILRPLVKDPIGLRQLVRVKLLPEAVQAGINPVKDIRMVGGESTAGEDFDGMFVESRRRRDQSSEEEHIRRRHREAMVLNDGSRPLGRGDIIQRER